MRCVSMLLWMIVALAGCGQGLPVAPASGVVLLDGSPLANASITTQPIATNSRNPGPGSFGRTDAEGRFDLESGQAGHPRCDHRRASRHDQASQ